MAGRRCRREATGQPVIAPPTYIYEGTTPGGRPFRLECRDGVNDQDVAHSVTAGDEYGLRGLDLSGWALDIGASIGDVAIPLALDHPGLRVVALEPVPESRELLIRNLALNGVADGQILVNGRAATRASVDGVLLAYGVGIHRYVGSMVGSEMVASVEGVSLGGLLDGYGIADLALLKADCEGCEWGFLDDAAVARVDLIVGEWHPPGDAQRLAELLHATHDVAVVGYHFTARRRRG